MPASDYLDFATFAQEFPFGSIRDNLHAAIIAQAVLRPWVKKGTKLDLTQFLIKSQDNRRQNRNAAFIQALKAMATKGKGDGNRSRKTGGKARTAELAIPKRTHKGKQKTRGI